jgi:hypothetical protein
MSADNQNDLREADTLIGSRLRVPTLYVREILGLA